MIGFFIESPLVLIPPWGFLLPRKQNVPLRGRISHDAPYAWSGDTLSFARQRENPFPNFEDSREGGMELSQEDHLEAKRIPKPRFFWGNANGKPDHGLTAHGIFSVGYLEAFY